MSVTRRGRISTNEYTKLSYSSRKTTVRGHEVTKIKPTIVVQNDMGNRYSSTTIIAPTTTTYREYPFEVFVEAAESPFDRDSSIRLDQIRTISIEERVEKSLGRLGAETMDAVDDGLKLSLGLT